MGLFNQIFKKNPADCLLDTCIESAEYLLEFPALEMFLHEAPSHNPRNAIKFEAMLFTYGMILNQVYQKLGPRRVDAFQNEIWSKFQNYVRTNRLAENLSGNFTDFCNNRFELNHNQIGQYLNSPAGSYSPKKLLANIFQYPLNQSNKECNNIEIEKYFNNRIFGILDIISKGINKSF